MILRKTNSRFVNFFRVVIPLTLFLLQGCGSESPLGLRTHTPVPTQRVCSPSEIGTPDPVKSAPSLIIILIQETQYTQYAKQIRELLEDGLVKGVQPGDSVKMFRLGVDDFEKAKVLNNNSEELDGFNIPATPTLFPTSVPPPNTSGLVCQTKICNDQATNEAGIATNIAAATATQSKFNFNCAMDDFNKQFATQVVQAEQTKAVILEDYKLEFDEGFNVYENQKDKKASGDKNEVFEGVAHASRVFINECQNFGRCLLIVFSDLQEFRAEHPTGPDYQYNLTNVNVLSVLLNCDEIYDPSCQKWEGFWTTQFSLMGATSVKYVNGRDAEKEIINFIWR